ncbi:MAG: hypothetical protein JRK53_10785 [Deltaproteobacteria bacterium]|nr:hypothetical protein [Deltaproteobacteria bacterium]MBW2283741.1 hypothetical protein [Deltaproteobacteria bacterium]
MSKLLGMTAGVLLVIGAFVVYMDKGKTLEKLKAHLREAAGPEVTEIVHQAKARVSSAVAGLKSSADETIQSADAPPAEDAAEPPVVSKSSVVENEETEDAVEAGVEAEPVLPEEPPEAVMPAEDVTFPRYWQAFWKPFRTELSARGFALNIGKATGLEIEVVEGAPGRFQAAFSYGDEAERRANMALIRERSPVDIRWGAGT